MLSHEYECPRCLNRYTDKESEKYGTDPNCPVCGSLAVESVDGCLDSFDVLRTGSGG
ncbi:MAG: hypothetical protein HQ553_12800 [Chloroflexi bacterium]|nr:hypothetical protein [Chloroflexota bacterium]